MQERIGYVFRKNGKYLLSSKGVPGTCEYLSWVDDINYATIFFMSPPINVMEYMGDAEKLGVLEHRIVTLI